MLPQPVKPIPIWIGGSSEPALKRAMRLDGWHGSRVSPEAAAPIVRPLRSGWDGKDEGALAARLAGYGEAGVGHVLVEPAEWEIEAWLRAVERVASAAEKVQ